MAQVIKVDGTIIEVVPENGKTFEIDEIKRHLGMGKDDLIQIVDMGDTLMVIDEEGKLKDLPFNPMATEIAHMYRAIFSADYISGDALICNSNEIE